MEKETIRDSSKLLCEIPIVYYTRTGQTRTFIKKVKEVIDVETIEIPVLKKGKEIKIDRIDKKFILLTPTYYFGQLPEEVEQFLNTENSKNLIAVMSSGNRNWGVNYALAGDKISSQYNVDLIGKFELAGSQNDVDALINYIREVSIDE